jgi:hypothetical protein
VTAASLDRTAAPLVVPLSLLAGVALAAYGGWPGRVAGYSCSTTAGPRSAAR